MDKQIVDLLIKYMAMAGRSSHFINGEDRKKWVLARLKEEMEYDDELEDIIIAMIDWIILIDKGGIDINPIVKKMFCCFK